MMRIRELRKKSGLTLVEVAKHVGVHYSAVICWENGKSYPTADKLPKIASLFGCTIDELYGRDPPEVAS